MTSLQGALLLGADGHADESVRLCVHVLRTHQIQKSLQIKFSLWSTSIWHGGDHVLCLNVAIKYRAAFQRGRAAG